MKELDNRDRRILKKAFLEKLNEIANGNEELCFDRTEIFKQTKLGGYAVDVVPFIVQELMGENLVKQCRNATEVSITHKGKQRLQRNIENNTHVILETLATEAPVDEVGRASLDGSRLQDLTELTSSEINDAVAVLADLGFVEPFRALGTYPFTFYIVTLTSRGRYEYQRRIIESTSKIEEVETPDRRNLIPRTPVGSPFGFTDLDWDTATKRTHDTSKLYVVFGYQFKSHYYETEKLKKNIYNMFQNAVIEYKKGPNPLDIQLEFINLAAGYGEHLFNKIAGDIISSDVAVFETSDLNPNVMIEMGVALTWDIRVLPIKREDRPKPPSDISGQTWVDYIDNGSKFLDDDHEAKLLRMIERSIQKKQAKL
jgi:hypothetical protein